LHRAEHRQEKTFQTRARFKSKIEQLAIAFNDWHRLSLPFLDPAKSRDDYWAAFLAELEKVRVPTGEGALKRALENVANLSASDLPKIPGYRDAPESWRRVLALHRELSVASKAYTYFLSYRDAAKAVPGMSQQTAHNITLALVRLYAVQDRARG
jgi:hypothetical protein